MPYIHSVSCAFPPHYYDQDTLINAFMKHWKVGFFNPGRIEAFHRNVLVGGRHLALPLDQYEELDGFGAHNDAWVEVAAGVAEQAVSELLQNASIEARDIQLLTSATVTGISVPSLEARLMNRIPFARGTKRLPIFGLGCLAGAAGINRVADYLVGHPQEAAVFFSVELCSLTVQIKDLSIANVISSGLFGDGGAAVLMVGDEHPLAKEAPFEMLAWRSAFFENTERVMGWDIVDSGFKVVLSNEVPILVSSELPGEMEALLKECGCEGEMPHFFIAHPGGPKVLKAMEEALHLENGELQHSWDSLATHGNMSSVSVLFVLHRTMQNLPHNGALGVITAMGPAFCAELGALRCHNRGN